MGLWVRYDRYMYVYELGMICMNETYPRDVSLRTLVRGYRGSGGVDSTQKGVFRLYFLQEPSSFCDFEFIKNKSFRR